MTQTVHSEFSDNLEVRSQVEAPRESNQAALAPRNGNNNSNQGSVRNLRSPAAPLLLVKKGAVAKKPKILQGFMDDGQ